VLDFLFSAIGWRPWRCRTCDKRFHARSVALAFSRYAHCPRCGNFDLERVARNRVEHGALAPLKRFLGFPAYRCDPCRHRFFAVLPPRRIVPSTILSERRNAAG
jgi:predicted RNA-binding Zn-ribbon protein involved in translation (DUF1610 family)